MMYHAWILRRPRVFCPYSVTADGHTRVPTPPGTHLAGLTCCRHWQVLIAGGARASHIATRREIRCGVCDDAKRLTIVAAARIFRFEGTHTFRLGTHLLQSAVKVGW